MSVSREKCDAARVCDDVFVLTSTSTRVMIDRQGVSADVWHADGFAFIKSSQDTF